MRRFPLSLIEVLEVEYDDSFFGDSWIILTLKSGGEASFPMTGERRMDTPCKNDREQCKAGDG